MTSRSGSKNRQRQKVVSVRLTDEEHALLLAVAARQGQTAPSVLRYTFLAEYTAEPGPRDAEAERRQAIYERYAYKPGPGVRL